MPKLLRVFIDIKFFPYLSTFLLGTLYLVFLRDWWVHLHSISLAGYKLWPKFRHHSNSNGVFLSYNGLQSRRLHLSECQCVLFLGMVFCWVDTVTWSVLKISGQYNILLWLIYIFFLFVSERERNRGTTFWMYMHSILLLDIY